MNRVPNDIVFWVFLATIAWLVLLDLWRKFRHHREMEKAIWQHDRNWKNWR